MKNICNHCGQAISSDVKSCPNCGSPLANAQPDNEKKLWEREDLKPIEETHAAPPVFPAQAREYTEHAHGKENATPPPPYHKKKRNSFHLVAVILAATAVALILLMCIVWIYKHTTVKTHVEKQQHTTITQGPNGSQVTITTNGNINPAQADSLMQTAMDEMAQTDSIMQAMMNSMMSGSPLGGMPQEENAVNAQPSRQRPARQLGKNGIANMTGNVGQRQLVMVLNMKDPQNVKGSGSFIVNKKEQGKLHMLGIQDGQDLTVSIYDSKNVLLGTLAGGFDGMTFEGYYLVDGKETPFQLMLQ